MFKRIKQFFGGANEQPRSSFAPQRPVATQSVHRPVPSQLPRPRQAEPAKAPAKTPAANGINNITGDDINISLAAVLNGLPPDLKARVGQYDVRAATLTISLNRVLPQLAQGAVKIPFGELRQAAPQLFSPGDDCDQREIALPLDDILARIPQGTIIPQKQKPAEVPKEIPAPFEGIKHPVNRAEPSVGNVSAPALGTSKRAPSGPIRVPVKAATESAAARHSSAPATPQPLSAEKITKAAPTSDKLAGANSLNSASASAPASQNIPAAASFMKVALHAVCKAWPNAVRSELGEIYLAKAEVEMPADVVQAAMKRGKVAFPWKTIRAWIVPAVASTSSANDDTVLELPLEAIMPAFLASQKSTAQSQKPVVDERIPDLFEVSPRPETAVTAKSTNGHVNDLGTLKPNHVNGSILAAAKRSGIGASSSAPEQKAPAQRQPPSEIVSRAAALQGVAGALVALPDGLMVASKLPQGTDGDTLAAILPHIFAKVNECTKEIRIGELSSLDFVASNVPWKIFQSNAMYLAAFGFNGEMLPTVQLAALARELH